MFNRRTIENQVFFYMLRKRPSNIEMRDYANINQKKNWMIKKMHWPTENYLKRKKKPANRSIRKLVRLFPTKNLYYKTKLLFWNLFRFLIYNQNPKYYIKSVAIWKIYAKKTRSDKIEKKKAKAAYTKWEEKKNNFCTCGICYFHPRSVHSALVQIKCGKHF